MPGGSPMHDHPADIGDNFPDLFLLILTFIQIFVYLGHEEHKFPGFSPIRPPGLPRPGQARIRVSDR